MKQLRDKYFQAIVEWDKKHRLVGKTSIRQLYSESLMAARDFRVTTKELLGAKAKALENVGTNSCPLTSPLVFVDIGAGSGILGVAWLLASRKTRVIFNEPDPKKASFLRLFLATHFRDRARVVDLPIQNVSRETLDKCFNPAATQYVFVTRAFSSDKTLEAHLLGTWMQKEEVFSFESDKNHKFFLQKLKI